MFRFNKTSTTMVVNSISYIVVFMLFLLLSCSSDLPVGLDSEATSPDLNDVSSLQKGGKNNGTKIVFTSRRNGPGDIFIMKTDGSDLVNLTNNPANDEDGMWSHGKIVFSSDRDGGQEIYIMNDDGSNVKKVTTNTTSADKFPDLSTNGIKIVFTRGNGPDVDVYMINTDGSGEVNLTNGPSGTSNAIPRWSPNGKKIVYNSTFGPGDADIIVMKADGLGKTNLTNSPGINDFFASWSPNGKKIAFTSIRMGPPHIYVMNADGSGDTQLTTAGVEIAPSWSPNGKTIAFFDVSAGAPDIVTIKTDGSNRTQLTTHPAPDEFPSWTNGNRGH